ncbi:uncharacterized protein [Rhodnius prolixus]|uniref:CABIT domain-containing protein n=1 Tax=Rhodnius prolixus TaxID=13249 RepID=T1I0D7_RHOPR
MSCKSKGEIKKTEGIPLREFLNKTHLPKVVRLVSTNNSSKIEPIDTDLVLLYKHYISERVEAISEDCTESLVIPHSYQGWFSVVTERGQIKAVCYTTVQKLVTSQTSSFLTLTDLVGYKLHSRTRQEGQHQRQHYSKTKIAGGQVLKLLAVYEDLNATRNKRLSWPMVTRTEANQYAQCLTNDDQVVYIPLTTSGEFYAVGTGNSEDTVSKVYQLPKLLRVFPLPVKVCIINDCKAQGPMVLERWGREEVVLTCVLGQKPKLLEIEADCKLLVSPPGHRYDISRILRDERVLQGFGHCEDQSESWTSNLKVSRHIRPRNAGLESGVVKSASFKFTRTNNSSNKDKYNIPYAQVTDYIQHHYDYL